LQVFLKLNYVNNELALHQTRLATGKRINYAYEDPAGLNIATTFDVRRQGLQIALSSIGDSKNMLATAEGGLRKIQDILVKMKSKAMEAIGDTVGQDERTAVLGQLQDYAEEIDAIAAQTQWNGRPLISGSASQTTSNSLSFLVDSTGGSVSFSFGSSRSFTVGTATSQLGFSTSDLNAASAGGAQASGVADIINTALNHVKTGVREVGSFMARLTFKEDSLTVQYINTEAAYNRIMNANMAEEQMEASKYMILQQTAIAMLAQANTAPQFLLTLFR
jgi:flagellin